MDFPVVSVFFTKPNDSVVVAPVVDTPDCCIPVCPKISASVFESYNSSVPVASSPESTVPV